MNADKNAGLISLSKQSTNISVVCVHMKNRKRFYCMLLTGLWLFYDALQHLTQSRSDVALFSSKLQPYFHMLALQMETKQSETQTHYEIH